MLNGPDGPSSAVEPAVRALVAVHLEIDPAILEADARLREDLRVDSLGAIELAMALEDEFDIALPEEVVANVRTYGDVVDVVAGQIARRTGPGRP